MKSGCRARAFLTQRGSTPCPCAGTRARCQSPRRGACLSFERTTNTLPEIVSLAEAASIVEPREWLRHAWSVRWSPKRAIRGPTEESLPRLDAHAGGWGESMACHESGEDGRPPPRVVPDAHTRLSCTQTSRTATGVDSRREIREAVLFKQEGGRHYGPAGRRRGSSTARQYQSARRATFVRLALRPIKSSIAG